MLLLLRYYLDLFIDFIFGLYYHRKAEIVVEPKNKLVLESAVSLAKKIRNREVTSEEVVRAYIERIKQVNPVLNAVVDERFEEAIEEARNIDNDIASNNVTEEDFAKRPFLGVPFTTKESVASKGLSNTLGLVSRKSIKANFDSDVVHTFKKAGAILLGVTNIPQLNGWPETSNPIYGTTGNPYNTTRTVGGSSGGEACIVAACGSAFGIGTELGGSIRLPSFMCGVFGHKPSSHLVSLKGIMYNTFDKKTEMAAVGPLTRYSDDLIPFLRVLLGENINKLKLDEVVNVRRLRIYYVALPGDMFVSPSRGEMNNTMMRAVDYFKSVQNEGPFELNIAELKYGGKVWFHGLTQVCDQTFTSDLANRQGEVTRIKELLKFCIRRSDFNIFVILNLITQWMPKINPKWAHETTKVLKDKLMEVLGHDAVLLYPSAPFPASYHYTSIFRPFNFNLFTVWNALNFCATQVPMGLNKEGMPVGLQVVAAPFHDHLTIAVAKELEKAFGGYVPPFEMHI